MTDLPVNPNEFTAVSRLPRNPTAEELGKPAWATSINCVTLHDVRADMWVMSDPPAYYFTDAWIAVDSDSFVVNVEENI